MPPRQALQTFDSRLAAAMGTVRDTQALSELLREGGSDPGVLALPSSQPTQQVLHSCPAVWYLLCSVPELLCMGESSPGAPCPAPR